MAAIHDILQDAAWPNDYPASVGLLRRLVRAFADAFSGKADKAAPSAAGNLASLDASGNLVDSGAKPADFAPRSALSGKADLMGGKVPAEQLPGYVDDVIEYAGLDVFPATGEEGKLYVAKDANKTYRWSGTQYTEVSPSPVPVAPSTSASDAGKPADAKATGDALAARPTKAQLDAGWWSEWTILCNGVNVTAQVPQPKRYLSDVVGWDVPTEYPTTSYDGILYDESTGYGEDTSLLEWTSSAGTWNATRHRVAAPVPTKPSDIGAASTNDVQLSPVYSQTPTFSEWAFSDGGSHTLVVMIGDVVSPWIYKLDDDKISKESFETEAEADVATRLTFYNSPVIATRTRTDIIGYTLGDQTGKPLASANALAGQTFDFATMAGVYRAVKALSDALGGTVANFPDFQNN